MTGHTKAGAEKQLLLKVKLVLHKKKFTLFRFNYSYTLKKMIGFTGMESELTNWSQMPFHLFFLLPLVYPEGGLDVANFQGQKSLRHPQGKLRLREKLWSGSNLIILMPGAHQQILLVAKMWTIIPCAVHWRRVTQYQMLFIFVTCLKILQLKFCHLHQTSFPCR